MYHLCKYLPSMRMIRKAEEATGGPSSSCEMIILRNNSHGGIIRVCMEIFTTPLRNKKIRQILKKKYLTLLPQRIACYLTAYFDEKSPFERVVHFEVFNVHKKSPRLNTPFPNARSEKRKIPAQNDRAATNPTQNSITNTVVSLQTQSCLILN